MELASALMALLMLLVVLNTLRILRTDYSRKTDAQLVRLRVVHTNRLAGAAKAGSNQYEAALTALGRLMSEMKRRGLVSDDHFVNEPVLLATLEHAARERYSTSVGEIQRRSSEGEPAALYQLSVLLGIAKELDVSRLYLERAAEAGDAQGQFAFALALFGLEDEQSAQREREALTWLRIAAEQGHGQARMALNGLIKLMPRMTIQSAVWDARRWVRAQNTTPRPHNAPRVATADDAPGRVVAQG